MTKKRDPARLIKLAMELCQGKGIEEAMLAAGYSEGAAKGKQIRWTDEKGQKHKGSPTEHPIVAAHIAEMQAEARKNTVVTIDNVVGKLEEAFTLAKMALNPSAMVSAAMGQAKVLGLIVERKEHDFKKPLSQWSEQEVRAALDEDDAGAAEGNTVH